MAVCSDWVLLPKKNASFLISLIVVILRVTKISVNNIRMIWNEQASTVWRTYHTYNHLIFSSLWGLSAYRIHIRTRNCPNCNLHSLVLIHSDCKILYIFNRSTPKKNLFVTDVIYPNGSFNHTALAQLVPIHLAIHLFLKQIEFVSQLSAYLWISNSLYNVNNPFQLLYRMHTYSICSCWFEVVSTAYAKSTHIYLYLYIQLLGAM